MYNRVLQSGSDDRSVNGEGKCFEHLNSLNDYHPVCRSADAMYSVVMAIHGCTVHSIGGEWSKGGDENPCSWSETMVDKDICQ